MKLQIYTLLAAQEQTKPQIAVFYFVHCVKSIVNIDSWT